MLKISGDLVLAPAVEAGGQRVDVESASNKDGHKSAHNVGRVEVMLGKGEHGNT